MQLDVVVNVHLQNWQAFERMLALLDALNQKVGKIMVKVSEVEARLQAVTETVGKIAAETTKSLQTITELRTEIETSDFDLPQSFMDKFATLEASVKTADDLVPDDVVVPPTDGGGQTEAG